MPTRIVPLSPKLDAGPEPLGPELVVWVEGPQATKNVVLATPAATAPESIRKLRREVLVLMVSPPSRVCCGQTLGVGARRISPHVKV